MRTQQTTPFAVTVLIGALSAFATSPAFAQVGAVRQFSITVLNAPDRFQQPVAESITNNGDVVGWATSRTSVIRAVQFSATTGTILTPFLTNDFNSFALGVNASGQVAGYFYNALDPALTPRATLYSLRGDSQIPLGALPGSARTDSVANAVNSSGQAVGWARDARGSKHAIEFSTTGNVDLADDFSEAFDINDRGQVVGVLANRATLFTPGGNIDLGSLYGPSSTSSAVAINDAGWAVGHSEFSEDDRATLFAAGSVIDLGTLGGSSRASDINDDGWIVGYSEKLVGDDEFRSTPFLWTNDDRMVALEDLIDPSSGWLMSQDEDATPIINDHGQIVVRAFHPLVGERLLLLSPSPVPEPSQWALMLAGAGWIGLSQRRRRHEHRRSTIERDL